jgi:hypothetical protein
MISAAAATAFSGVREPIRTWYPAFAPQYGDGHHYCFIVHLVSSIDC